MAEKAKAGRLYIMRHGRTVMDDMDRADGWLNMPLNSKGQKSLIEAQQLLKMCPISSIYAPDLKRTEETADIMASGIMSQPKVVIMDALKTWNLGSLAGTKKGPARKKEVKGLMANPTEVPEGGESYSAFKKRMTPAVNTIMKEVRDDGETLLLVCSGSNIREISRQLAGSTDKLALDEGGLMCLTPRPGGWKIKLMHGAKHGEVSGAHADAQAGMKDAMDGALAEQDGSRYES